MSILSDDEERHALRRLGRHPLDLQLQGLGDLVADVDVEAFELVLVVVGAVGREVRVDPDPDHARLDDVVERARLGQTGPGRHRQHDREAMRARLLSASAPSCSCLPARDRRASAVPARPTDARATGPTTSMASCAPEPSRPRPRPAKVAPANHRSSGDAHDDPAHPGRQADEPGRDPRRHGLSRGPGRPGQAGRLGRRADAGTSSIASTRC